MIAAVTGHRPHKIKLKNGKPDWDGVGPVSEAIRREIRHFVEKK